MKAEDFDKQIAQKIKDQEITPPSAVWANIVQALDQPEQKVQKEQKEQKKRFPFYTSMAIAASLLLFLGFAFKLFLNQEKPKSADLLSHNHPIESIGDVAKVQQNPSADLNEEEKSSRQALKNTTESKDRLIAKALEVKTANMDNSLSLNALTKKTETVPKNKLTRAIIAPTMEAYAGQDIQLSQVSIADNQQKPHMQNIAALDVKLENEEDMQHQRHKPNLLVKVLNTLTQQLNPTQTELLFNQDEEGTLLIDFSNSLVKN